ncbi:glycosyltransferase involved in cell wall biosynthesis [Lutibacter oceani]|uniref:Glycosyltransferase involved in cell wall biosynthesis n=1 Tax=Lutibacter oceani TaxID=1853311 RepID=A0A3D9RR73_9FLAO|nr:glycosyltransferase family A protein [Lutibacter oceani]REE81988.1 glycosyltransferase involved in cell wall biosynthesis [Lutibacter oceani]
MKISIVTPHFNDFEGIKQTYNCLKNQDSDQWEWVIVDDFSDGNVKLLLKEYIENLASDNVKLIFNDTKTNGSVCRNIGVDYASNEHLVFLDSDDIISEDFVSNRAVEVEDFVVFKNSNVLDEHGNNKPASNVSSNFLDHFLQAKFIWPITAILWNKEFLIKIGKFNPDLKRLQDIELSIRALLLGTNYRVIDNKVDFFYCVAPIDIKKRPVKLICDSVNYLITNIYNNYKLNKQQQSLLKGYYFVCVRYLYKSKLKEDIKYVKNSLQLFYSKKYITFFGYTAGLLFLKLLKYNIISNDLFIRLNRKFFK